MIVCDKCGKTASSVSRTSSEYGSMDLCGACMASLTRATREAGQRVLDLMSEAQERAKKEWMGISPEEIAASERKRRRRSLVGTLAPGLVAFLIVGVLFGIQVALAYRDQHPRPGQVRTWYDDDIDPPFGGLRHAVGQDDGSIRRTSHSLDSPTCEFCWLPRAKYGTARERGATVPSR